LLDQLLTLNKFFSWKTILLDGPRTMHLAREPIRGYLTTLAFWTLMDAGLLEALEKEPKIQLKDFAEKRNLNPKILFFVCRYLHRNQYLRLRGDEVGFTPKGKKFWKEVYGVFHLFFAYEPMFSTLSAQLKNQASFGRELSRREDEVARGFQELGGKFLFPLMRGILEEHRFKKVIDLGCGEVYLSAFLCSADPQIECLGIDHSPEIVARASQRIQELGFESRIKLLLADMFQLEVGEYNFSNYEVVTAIDLFHGYFWEGPEKLRQLFPRLKRVFHRQQFLISEICLPPDSRMRNIAYPNPEHELFHDLTHQRSFSPGELEALLQEAGFQIKKKYNLNKIAGRICLLVG
jgi:2-polyprenyl-3-methyl-5-hydroxy-6-metoxy-1,4-benzoquinol methylase